MKQVFQKVFSIEVDDALRFDVENITIKNITEFKEYHGLNVSTVAYLDRTRIPISIDIGFGDVTVPAPQNLAYPVILGDMPSFDIKAYSLETVVAEHKRRWHEFAAHILDAREETVVRGRESKDTQGCTGLSHSLSELVPAQLQCLEDSRDGRHHRCGIEQIGVVDTLPSVAAREP